MLHGKFVSPQAFANAVSAGTWGYFYESTWLDLYLTPDYHYGEVSAHDEGKKELTLDVWRTNKNYHYPESVEKQVAVTYGDDTVFLIEGEESTADQALNHTGGTRQVHPPREQVILLENRSLLLLSRSVSRSLNAPGIAHQTPWSVLRKLRRESLT